MSRDHLQSAFESDLFKTTATHVTKKCWERISHQQHILPAVVVAIERGATGTERIERRHWPRLFRPAITQTTLLSHIDEREICGNDNFHFGRVRRLHGRKRE